MLYVQDLRVNIRRLAILRGVTLEVPAGTIVALVGRNGAGKTTTLRAVMGLVPASGGSITLDGSDLLRVPAHGRAALGIGYMPEDRRLIPQLTVEENLLLPAWANRMSDATGRLRDLYERMPALAAFASRRAGHLSGGQQKLVAAARAMMTADRVLLLDEPFEGLAPALVGALGSVLRGLAQEGRAVLVAESEHTHVAALAHRAHTIERGETVGCRRWKNTGC
ncbi:MAG: ATP-binding cassette domain-containing protein [Armatimonadota bacterium]|nr:ATP-binding cassette domain-containing protein [Armatimonadota bacterium]MDR5697769.1 ATP-binding cassette domain-containing protein [Armatimonadota bacterium]